MFNIQALLPKVLRKLKQFLLNPKLKVSKTDLTLKSFGSAYGGWVVADSKSLHNSTIVSCGLGEDASFDVEIANEYGLSVVIVDPTPRAVSHFEQMKERLGQGKIIEYSAGGLQSILSYELTNLTTVHLRLIPKAIWISNEKVRFYSPPNEQHVSHSISNFQNNFSTETNYIDVDAITLKKLIENESLDSIPLIKLDIEGAEIEVITGFLSDGIFPGQILVEYDEMIEPSLKTRRRILLCHKNLLANGYHLVNFSKPSNFLYISNTAI